MESYSSFCVWLISLSVRFIHGVACILPFYGPVIFHRTSGPRLIGFLVTCGHSDGFRLSATVDIGVNRVDVGVQMSVEILLSGPLGPLSWKVELPIPREVPVALRGTPR